MAQKMIQVGAGGFGASWCRHFLPPNVADGLIEVVAAVDVNPDVHRNAARYLKLPPEKCYTDLARAFDENPADFCTVVVPPAFHESVVDHALAHEMHILSEKPIADTLETSCRIAEKVRRAKKKMAVTMSHRFDRDKTTLRRLLRSGELGALDYLVCRFTDNCRALGSWGAFRHTMDHPLLIEGAVHHLDFLADFAGAPCDTIYARTWNPAWSSFAGDSQALVVMDFPNGVKATYEGAISNAKPLNGWGKEYVRAECEGGTVVLNHRRIRILDKGAEPRGVPLLKQRKWTNVWLIQKFVRWLDGGEPMETNVDDNLQSVALVFAAIESSRTGQPVKVQELLERVSGDTLSHMSL